MGHPSLKLGHLSQFAQTGTSVSVWAIWDRYGRGSRALPLRGRWDCAKLRPQPAAIALKIRRFNLRMMPRQEWITPA